MLCWLMHKRVFLCLFEFLQAGGHALLCCGKRHEALRVVLDAGCDDAQRVIGGALIQLKLLSSGQVCEVKRCVSWCKQLLQSFAWPDEALIQCPMKATYTHTHTLHLHTGIRQPRAEHTRVHRCHGNLAPIPVCCPPPRFGASSATHPSSCAAPPKAAQLFSFFSHPHSTATAL